MGSPSSSAQRSDLLTVDWCGEHAPAPALVAHLAEHRIALRSGRAIRVPSPSRLSAVSRTAQLLVGKRAAALQGRRIGVLHPDPAAADTLAQALRARGATVAVMSLDPAALERFASLEPEVIVVEPRHYEGVCFQAATALLKHPLLRWSCVLLSPASPLSSDGVETQDVPALCADIQLLCADYDAATACARGSAAFTVALESVGPGRALRALVDSGKAWRARFATPTLTMELDIAERLLVGARGTPGRSADATLLGIPGLARLLTEVSGTVHARPVARPAVTNIMTPLEAAFATALSVSVRPPSPSHMAPASRPHEDASTTRMPPVQTRTLIGLFAPAPPAAAAARSSAPVSATQPVTAQPPSAEPLAASAPAFTAARSATMPFEQTVSEPPSPPPAASMALPDAVPRRSRWVRTAERPATKVTAGAVIAFSFAAVLLAIDTPTGSHALPAQRADIAPVPASRAASAPTDASPSLLLPTTAPGLTLEPPPWESTAATRVPRDGPPAPTVETPTSKPLERTQASAPSARTVRLQIQRSNALARQGAVLLRKGRTLEAKRRYETALQTRPTNPRALAGLTRVALRQRDSAAAMRHATALAQAQPRWPMSHLLLGDASRLTGEQTAARASWQHAARLGSRAAQIRLRAAPVR